MIKYGFSIEYLSGEPSEPQLFICFVFTAHYIGIAVTYCVIVSITPPLTLMRNKQKQKDSMNKASIMSQNI